MSLALPPRTSDGARDSSDLAQIGWLLLRHVRTILALIAVGTIFGLLYALHTMPQFTASASMYLGDAQTSPNNPSQPAASNLGFLSGFSNADDVGTQIELIKAKALVQQAVLETGLNAQVTPAGAPVMRYWRWKFLNSGSVGAFEPDSSSLEALSASSPGNFVAVLKGDGSYQLFRDGGWFNKPVYVLAGILGQPASGNGIQMLLKPADSDFQDISGKTYDINVANPDTFTDTIISDLLNVTSDGSDTQPTKIVSLTFRWGNPYQAKTFLNQVMQDFIASQLSWKTEEASATENFVSTQLAKTSASLAEADKNLALYQAQTKIMDVSLSSQALLTTLTQDQTQLTTLQLQQEALQQLSHELNRSTVSLNPYLASQTNDVVLAKLTNDLSDAEVKLANLRSVYVGGSNEIQSAAGEIALLQSSIKTTINNDLAAADQNVANLNQIIAGLQNQIKAMPAESLKLLSLQRSSDVLGKLYVLLMEKEDEAEVSKATTIIDTRVITLAEAPTLSSSPKVVASILFGAFAGLVLGVSLVIGQRVLSRCFDSAEEVRTTVHLPVYGLVSGRKLSSFEEFRLLRTRIYRTFASGDPVIITIIGASRDPNTTTIAINLSKSLADNGKRVLLIDADFELAPVSSDLRIERMPGLIDWLASNHKSSFASLPGEKFNVLPAGRSSLVSEEVFTEPRLANLFSRLKEEFDFIVLNGPPLPEVADGLTLGFFSDLILSVVSISQTQRHIFAEHREILSSLEKPYGIVIASPEMSKGTRSRIDSFEGERSEKKTSVQIIGGLSLARGKAMKLLLGR